jgi:hypothetical protein
MLIITFKRISTANSGALLIYIQCNVSPKARIGYVRWLALSHCLPNMIVVQNYAPHEALIIQVASFCGPIHF